MWTSDDYRGRCANGTGEGTGRSGEMEQVGVLRGTGRLLDETGKIVDGTGGENSGTDKVLGGTDNGGLCNWRC